MRAAALIRMLAARERLSTVTLARGLAAMAVLAGLAAVRLAADGGAGPQRGPARLVAEFDTAVAVMLAVLGCVRLTSRPAEDHADGWLHGHVGCGGSRAGWLGAVYLAVTLWLAAALTVVLATFGSTVLLAGGGSHVLERMPRVWLGGLLLIASFSAFGLAAGVVAKDAGAALALAALAFVLPFALTVPWVILTDAPGLPRWAGLVLFGHLPPLGVAARHGLLLHHAVYLGAAYAAGRWLAPRVVGRWS